MNDLEYRVIDVLFKLNDECLSYQHFQTWERASFLKLMRSSRKLHEGPLAG